VKAHVEEIRTGSVIGARHRDVAEDSEVLTPFSVELGHEKSLREQGTEITSAANFATLVRICRQIGNHLAEVSTICDAKATDR